VFDNDDGLTPPRPQQGGRADPRDPGRLLRLVSHDPAQPCSCPPGYHEYGAHAPGQRPAGTPLAVPPGAYPVEDLAAMSPSAAEMLLHRATIEAESDAEAYRHVVITRDTATGVLTFAGPFETGLEALSMAHDFVGKYRDLQPHWDFTLTVAPLLDEG